MKPTIPAELMKRYEAARAASKSATNARNALDELRDALKAAMEKAEEVESNAEAIEEVVVREIRQRLAVLPGAASDGNGLADLDEDKAGRLHLCMADGTDVPVEVG